MTGLPIESFTLGLRSVRVSQRPDRRGYRSVSQRTSHAATSVDPARADAPYLLPSDFHAFSGDRPGPAGSGSIFQVCVLIFVFVHIAVGNAFGLVTRYAHGTTMTYFTVGAVNYATAMVVAVTWAVLDGGLTFEWPAIVFGIVQGIVYQTMYIVLFGMIALGGLSVSFTVNRLAIAIPIAGAIFLWGEAPSAFRVAGILVSFVALPLIGADAQKVARRTGASSRLMPLLSLYAVVSLGFSGLAARAFVEMRIEANAVDLSAFLFITATVSSIVTWPLVRRLARNEATRRGIRPGPIGRRVQSRAVVVGMALGVLNFVQSITLVNALIVLPASFVFPFTASAALLILTAADYLIFKQRFGRLTIVGLSLSAMTVLLINF